MEAKEVLVLKKGMRVIEPTKKVGHVPRRGVVVHIESRTVEVRWDDGHTSRLTDAVLMEEKDHAEST